MKQNPPAEETKPQVEIQPPPKPTSPAEVPLWLVTNFFFALLSPVSRIYYFLVERLEARRRDEDFETPRSSANQQSEPASDWAASGQNRERVKLVVGPILGLAVAYFAQAVFDSTVSAGIFQNWKWFVFQPESNRLWLGAGIYLVAVLIWIFTAPAIGSGDPIVNPAVSTSEKDASLRPFLLVTGLIAYLVAVLSFWAGGENAFVRIMWGAGVVCFLLSQLPVKASHPQAESSPRFTWKNWLILGLILLAGFWLRYYQVATIPDDLHGDMASHGRVARDFLLGIQHDIFGFGWTATPTIGFLPAFLTMAIFGNNIFGLQMAAVIGGTFSLLAVYLLTWRWFDSHRLASLTTALVAINIVHIHFSRIFNMEPWPLSNFAIFLLVDGFRSRRSASFGLAGVCIGFSLLMYTSGRALPFILIVFVLYAFFFKRLWITQNLRGFILLVVGVMVAMGPALVYYLSVWKFFIQRSREVYLFSEGVMQHSLSKYNTDSALTVLLTQIKFSLLMFHQTGDTSTQFGYPHPMFSSLVSPLILLGLGYALRHWRKAGMAFVLIWLSVIMVLGSILTIDAPFWPRLVGVLPAAALLIAIAFDQTIELGRKIFGSLGTVFISALIAVFLAMVGYLNWTDYHAFVEYRGSPSTLIGRYIGRLPADVTACGILTDPQLTVRETSFLAWPHKLVDIAPDAPTSELEKCTGESIVWAISSENIGWLDAIRARWPGGILDQHYNPIRDYTVTFYLVGVASPDSHPVEIVDSSARFAKGAGVVLLFVLLGVLLRFFLRSAILETLWRERAPKNAETPTGQNARQPISRENIFAGVSRWYDETRSFTFSMISPKLIASILLPLLAVGLAYFAQTFLDQGSSFGLHLPVDTFLLKSEGQQLGVASLIFVIAALLWTFTTIGGAKDLLRGISHMVHPLQPMMGSAVQIAGVFLTVGSMIIYVVMDENAVVRWLWVLGLGLFFASLLFKTQSPKAVLREESPSFTWGHILVLISLLVVAFVLRVYRLYDIPLDLSTDMASVGINARDYLMGVEKRIFGTGWYYYPRFVFLPYAASMWLAGNNLYGLNFGTVILGTFNVLGAYLFVWRSFDRHRLALLTAVLVTINPAHIEFSRIPSYVDPWTLGFLGLFFFMDGLKGRRWASLALAGLLTGLTITSYPSGRAIIPILAVGFASAWLFNRKWVTDNKIGFVWMLLGGLVALGPNLVYFITDWGVYMQRSREVIITDPGVIEHLKFTYEVDSFWKILWEQTKRSVLQFNYYTDRSAQFFYPHPMFNSLVSPLLLLGFGMSLFRWKKPEFLISLSSFLIILVMGSILTNDAPTWVRLVGIITFAALLIALVLDQFAVLLEELSMKPFVPLVMLGVALLLGRLAVADWNNYLEHVSNEDIVRPEIHVGRYLDTLPDNIDVCGITDERDYLVSQEEIQFFGWPRSIQVIPAETAILTPDLCPYKNVVWILSPVYDDRLAEIQVLWPGGTMEQHKTKSGWHVFTSYMVLDGNTP